MNTPAETMRKKRVLSRPLGKAFDRALEYAHHLHREQPRKGKDVPYIGHLLGVASLVLEAGGDEELAIAALLHDVVEDQGGSPRLQEVREMFGERVARVVEGCTDSFVEDPDDKENWCLRKQRYIAHVLEHSDADTRLVSAADKVHNARAILNDHHEAGDHAFDKFTARKEGTLWYYRSLVQAFRAAEERRGDPQLAAGRKCLVDELQRIVDELERRAGGPGANPCQR